MKSVRKPARRRRCARHPLDMEGCQTEKLHRALMAWGWGLDQHVIQRQVTYSTVDQVIAPTTWHGHEERPPRPPDTPWHGPRSWSAYRVVSIADACHTASLFAPAQRKEKSSHHQGDPLGHMKRVRHINIKVDGEVTVRLRYCPEVTLEHVGRVELHEPRDSLWRDYYPLVHLRLRVVGGGGRKEDVVVAEVGDADIADPLIQRNSLVGVVATVTELADPPPEYTSIMFAPY